MFERKKDFLMLTKVLQNRRGNIKTRKLKVKTPLKPT